MTTTPIDLARLPVPSVVEVIDFEAIYAERKAFLISLYPEDQQSEVAATLKLESEPLSILLQENAFREVVLRQRINDAARAVMLAYAQGADLEHLAALLGVERLVITPADPKNDIALVMESDKDLRKRVQLAPESFSVAGPEGAYVSATLNADGRILDAAAKSPSPGQVLISILSRDGDGSADEYLVALVESKLKNEDVRPLTDNVTVQSAEIVTYEVEALIFSFPGPDAAVVVAEARKRLDAYLEETHRIGRAVVISGIHAALQVEGIERVELKKPVANIATNNTQAPYCTGITVIYGGVHG